jgi:molybdopterin converting factor subunit 1
MLYFGRLMDLLGASSETLDLPHHVTDTSALRLWLDNDRQLKGALLAKSVRMVVNNEIVSDPWAISDTDEIAFLPPVGGG